MAHDRAPGEPVPDQEPVYRKSRALIALQLFKRWRNMIYAKRDRVISYAATRRLFEHLPGAEVAAVDGPHLLLQAAPLECAAIVAEFLLRRARTAESKSRLSG